MRDHQHYNITNQHLLYLLGVYLLYFMTYYYGVHVEQVEVEGVLYCQMDIIKEEQVVAVVEFVYTEY